MKLFWGEKNFSQESRPWKIPSQSTRGAFSSTYFSESLFHEVYIVIYRYLWSRWQCCAALFLPSFGEGIRRSIALAWHSMLYNIPVDKLSNKWSCKRICKSIAQKGRRDMRFLRFKRHINQLRYYWKVSTPIAEMYFPVSQTRLMHENSA